MASAVSRCPCTRAGSYVGRPRSSTASVAGVPAVATSRAGRSAPIRLHASSRKRASTYARHAASSLGWTGSSEEALDQLDDPEAKAHRRQSPPALGDQQLGAAPADVEEREGAARRRRDPTRRRGASGSASSSPLTTRGWMSGSAWRRARNALRPAPAARRPSRPAGPPRPQGRARSRYRRTAASVRSTASGASVPARREPLAEARDGLVGPQRDEPVAGSASATRTRTVLVPRSMPARRRVTSDGPRRVRGARRRWPGGSRARLASRRPRRSRGPRGSAGPLARASR